MGEEKKEESSILKDFIPQLKNFVQSETVFGEPYHVGEVTVIPVNSVKVGFGFGNRNNRGSTKNVGNAGGGGGVMLTPVAFIVIRGDTVTLQSLSSGTVENVMEKIPDFLDKIANVVQKNFSGEQTSDPKKV